jgi:hypothetical protein
MRRASIVVVAIALAVAGPALAADTTRWLNVHVTEAEEGTNVQVHLPIDLVLSVIQAVNVENFHAGKVDMKLADADINWSQIFQAVKSAPDGEFVKVDASDAKVLVSKAKGTITIDVNATDEEKPALVKVTVPASLVDALSLDENNQIDVAAMLRSFDSLPSGDLVTVDSPDAKVRVWIE